MSIANDPPPKTRKQNPRRKSEDLAEYERWNCPYDCGKFFRTTSTRSIHKHRESCSNNPNNMKDSFGNIVPISPTSALASSLAHVGLNDDHKLHRRPQRRRRSSTELEEFEKWRCPNPNCTQFYKKTSSRSINRHLADCSHQSKFPPNKGISPIPEEEQAEDHSPSHRHMDHAYSSDDSNASNDDEDEDDSEHSENDSKLSLMTSVHKNRLGLGGDNSDRSPMLGEQLTNHHNHNHNHNHRKMNISVEIPPRPAMNLGMSGHGSHGAQSNHGHVSNNHHLVHRHLHESMNRSAQQRRQQNFQNRNQTNDVKSQIMSNSPNPNANGDDNTNAALNQLFQQLTQLQHVQQAHHQAQLSHLLNVLVSNPAIARALLHGGNISGSHDNGDGNASSPGASGSFPDATKLLEQLLQVHQLQQSQQPQQNLESPSVSNDTDNGSLTQHQLSVALLPLLGGLTGQSPTLSNPSQHHSHQSPSGLPSPYDLPSSHALSPHALIQSPHPLSPPVSLPAHGHNLPNNPNNPNSSHFHSMNNIRGLNNSLQTHHQHHPNGHLSLSSLSSKPLDHAARPGHPGHHPLLSQTALSPLPLQNQLLSPQALVSNSGLNTPSVLGGPPSSRDSHPSSPRLVERNFSQFPFHPSYSENVAQLSVGNSNLNSHSEESQADLFIQGGTSPAVRGLVMNNMALNRHNRRNSTSPYPSPKP